MLDDTRIRRWCAHLDDVRTEVAGMEDEGHLPTRERGHITAAHDAINNAIRALNYAAGRCEVCGGVGKVLRAAREEDGFNWLGGECIPCPACGGSS